MELIVNNETSSEKQQLNQSPEDPIISQSTDDDKDKDQISPDDIQSTAIETHNEPKNETEKKNE